MPLHPLAQAAQDVSPAERERIDIVVRRFEAHGYDDAIAKAFLVAVLCRARELDIDVDAPLSDFERRRIIADVDRGVASIANHRWVLTAWKQGVPTKVLVKLLLEAMNMPEERAESCAEQCDRFFPPARSTSGFRPDSGFRSPPTRQAEEGSGVAALFALFALVLVAIGFNRAR